jgi:Na+(H+)/acetate symporter ActP
MSKPPHLLKVIGYAFVVSIGAAFAVLLAGAGVFGFQLDRWAEWEGRLVGVIATIAAIVGAVVGLWLALRAQRRTVE